MNTILTDDELKAECRIGFGIDPVLDGNLMKFGRAVEAAVLAKLAQQAPVASVRTWHKNGDQHAELDDWGLGLASIPDGTHNLYTHPAPQQADRQRVPEGWHDVVQKVAEENELEPELIAGVFAELLPVFMADKDAAGYVTIPLDSLIECDSYDVHGSDFYRCKVCGAESGAGVLNKGISHASDCPLAAAPEAPAQAESDLLTIAYMDGFAKGKQEAQASAVDERAAFEAWVTELGVAMHYEGDGHYGNATVARWWEAWQARAALAQKGGAA